MPTLLPQLKLGKSADIINMEMSFRHAFMRRTALTQLKASTNLYIYQPLMMVASV